jgi:parvulin-like peptidyl-prolyl isomerase
MPNLAALLLPVLGLQGPVPQTLLPKPPAPEKVIARVNGVAIRAADVEALLWDWRGQEVTQDLITYHLILGEAKRLKVEAKPAEIEASYAERLEEYRRQTSAGTEVEDTLRAQGFPKSRLYIRVHTELLVNRIAMRDFRPNDYVRISTAAFHADDAQKETPQKRAEAAHAQLVKGEEWTKVVQASDLDEGSKAAGGHLGWRAVNAFPAAVQPEVRGLKAGGFTKPIALPDGNVQIFRIEARGTEAKDADARELQESFLAGARQKLLQRLRAEAKIERPK